MKRDENIEKIIFLLNKKLKSLPDLVSKDSKNKPIFIVGLPRSGTTLLEQLIIHIFKLGYIDNISAKFWNAPEYGIAISNSIVPFEKRSQSSFKSEFGFTSDILSPHEFGYFWRRFFKYPQKHHEISNVISKKEEKVLKKEINKMSSYFGESFVFKNPVAITLNADVLYRIFPEALFILIERNSKEVANSILNSRKKYSGSINKWFSGIPKHCFRDNKIKSPFDQVARQVYFYEKKIKSFLKNKSNNNRILRINYGDLTLSPEKEMLRISKFFKNNSVVKNRMLEDIPRKEIINKKTKLIWKKEIEVSFKKYFYEAKNK